MQSLGIVRRVDALGRVVLPMELRKQLELETGDALEIFTEDNKVILKKYQPACIFCGNARDISSYKERNVCESCAREIARKLVEE